MVDLSDPACDPGHWALPSACGPQKSPAYAELSNGGPDKDRTCDLLHAMRFPDEKRFSFNPV